MNTNIFEAREYLVKAREALRRGDKIAARILGKRAAVLAPEMEDAWLVLTASDTNPQNALAHARRALEVNPESARARQGLKWAVAQAEPAGAGSVRVKQDASMGWSASRRDVATSLPKRLDWGTSPGTRSRIKGRNWLYTVLLTGAGCFAAGLVGLFLLAGPALASIAGNASAPVSAQENLWASVDIAKPTVTPIALSIFAPPTDAPMNEPSDETAPLYAELPTSVPTDMPTLVPTDVPMLTPQTTETPGTMAMEIVPDTPTSQYVATVVANEQPSYSAKGNGERWIDVNLTEQRVYAYEGDVIVNSFLVSTGTWRTPTVTGKYKIYVKVGMQDMSGPGYYLRDVPNVMFFYKGYGFHGTYWHNNFGTPMSRGCVNLTIPDSEWLFNWASVGTVVNVHY